MRLNKLTRYNPFRPLLGRSLLDLDIDPFLAIGENPLELSKNTFLPAVDIKETPKEFLVKADVPGIAKENLDIRMDNHILTIQGSRTEKKEEKDNLILMERYENFYRRFTLPETADESKISASFKDGVLSIKIPKHTKGKKEYHQKIKIQ